MEEFIKILLFVLVALITNVNETSATLAFPDIQKVASYFSFYTEIANTSLGNVIEIDLARHCENQ